MKAIKEKADEMQKHDASAAIKYRENMAKAWSKIVQSETPTKKMTLDDILHFGS
jgi:hypothetical protein